MNIVTLEEAKSQLSIPVGRTDLDERIERLVAAAEKWAKNFLNVDSLAEFDENSPSSPDSPADVALPEDMKSAILLHVEAEFDRDEKNFELILKRAHDMLWPYRQGLGV